MNTANPPASENRIFTIPNLLSMFRIVLIPVIVWLYCFRGAYVPAFFVLLLSGLTDIADGYIARRFHMISALGKALDPVADKLTQGTALLCLGIRFPELLWLALVLLVKEVVTGILSLLAIRKTQTVRGADWHGKILTCLLYATMMLHMLWVNIPRAVTLSLSAVCLAAMILSFVLYLVRNLRDLGGKKQA